MYLNNIQAINNTQNIPKSSITSAQENVFANFFEQAINLLDNTNKLQIDAQNKQLDFITGKSDDIIALTMANSRASSAIQFTSQVTNKILNAYQEIMRIAL